MPILAGGGDLIWVVVIVGSIIAQIIKAKKNAANPPPKSPQKTSGSADGAFTASSNELKNFLESIGVAPPAPKPQQVAPQAILRAQPVHISREVASAPPPPPLTAPVRIKHKQPPVKIQTGDESNVERVEDAIPPLTRIIKDELKNKDATRKAIILREILGPPIALR